MEPPFGAPFAVGKAACRSLPNWVFGVILLSIRGPARIVVLAARPLIRRCGPYHAAAWYGPLPGAPRLTAAGLPEDRPHGRRPCLLPWTVLAVQQERVGEL